MNNASSNSGMKVEPSTIVEKLRQHFVEWRNADKKRNLIDQLPHRNTQDLVRMLQQEVTPTTITERQLGIRPAGNLIQVLFLMEYIPTGIKLQRVFDNMSSGDIVGVIKTAVECDFRVVNIPGYLSMYVDIRYGDLILTADSVYNVVDTNCRCGRSYTCTHGRVVV